jgi:hypothetical protein
VSETETDRSRISRTRQTRREVYWPASSDPGLLIIRTAVSQCFSSGGRGGQHVLVGFASLYVCWVESFLWSRQCHRVAFLALLVIFDAAAQPTVWAARLSSTPHGSCGTRASTERCAQNKITHVRQELIRTCRPACRNHGDQTCAGNLDSRKRIRDESHHVVALPAVFGH